VGQSVHPVDVLRVGGSTSETRHDVVAAEEPLEIRLEGAPFVVTMRTPGADRELAAGFLLAEQIIDGPDDLGTIHYCTDAGGPAEAGHYRRNGEPAANVLNVTLTGAASARAASALARRRMVTTTSACGVCGRQSIEDLIGAIRAIDSSWSVPRSVISALPARLRAAQSAFEETGGLHAAGLFDRAGTLMAVAEDVGRHNAVDKVVGSQLLMDRFPLSERILFVSGRTSFEIVQKAVTARIPVVAAVSAPSSLAIELARDAKIALLGFVRGGTFNIYASPERIEL
jgi:FdhD protein